MNPFYLCTDSPQVSSMGSMLFAKLIWLAESCRNVLDELEFRQAGL
jgi:hypothetical protein